ncbi:MAG: hypothetical protein AAFP22_22100, partial [Planctomycetota bacterium]
SEADADDTADAHAGRELLTAELRDGYPRKGDTSPENRGRGPTRWTWAFAVEPGAVLVASRLTVKERGATGDSAVLVSGSDLEEAFKLPTERLLVFVNIAPGSVPDVRFVREDAAPRPARHVWSPRAKSLGIAVEGEGALSDRAVARPGETVRVMALMTNDRGEVLTAADVSLVQVHLFKMLRVGGSATALVETQRPDGPDRVGAFASLQRNDPRYPDAEGYSVAGEVRLPVTDQVGRYVAELHVTLTNGKVQIEDWTIDVEAGPGSSRR